MKISYSDWIKKLNERLEYNNQTLRVVDYNRQYLKLSNDVELTGNDFTKFKKRILNKKTDIWVKNADNLFNGLTTVDEIKSVLASIGGKSCQKLHGPNIVQNLNTGVPWNAGTKGQRTGTNGPRPQLVKDKISKKNKGAGNGMYGTTMSDSEKKKRSKIMKQKILLGEFTPNSNNRNTHWDSYFDGKKYRSSWEALYQYINPSAEYEVLRINYKINNKEYIYIVDFLDKKNKFVVEVKPEELCIGYKFQAKLSALGEWANDNGYTVIIVNKKWLKAQKIDIDYSKFDENTTRKIKALYEIN
jgi:hypothetical protein